MELLKRKKKMDLLDERIDQELELMNSLDPCSENYSTALDNLTRLYKLKMEKSDKNNKRMIDISKLILEVMGIILPLKLYSTWMARGFEFEKTGTFTSSTFRNLTNKFRPTK